jgi:hypothetical protein
MSHDHTTEDTMFRKTRPFTRIAVLASTVLGLLFVTAGQAAAIYPRPEPSGTGSAYDGPGTAQVQTVTDNSVSAMQWVLFTAAILGAIAIGAALMHLVQRRRVQLAH